MKRLLMVFVLFFMFYCQAWGAYEKSGIVYYPTDGTSAAALLVGIEAKGTPCIMKFVHTSGVSTPYIFPSGVTFPEYVTLKPENGAMLVPSSGVTLRCYPNNIEADNNQQIFDGEGSVIFSDNGNASAWWFKGSDIGEKTNNASNAFADILTGTVSLYGSGIESGTTMPELEYSTTIQARAGVKIDFNETYLEYTGSSVAIQNYGGEGSFLYPIKIDGIKITTDTAAKSGTTGLLLNGTSNCDVNVDLIRNFQYGIVLAGDPDNDPSGTAGACAYNNIWFNTIEQAQYGIYQIAIRGSERDGYTNANNIKGIRMRPYASVTSVAFSLVLSGMEDVGNMQFNKYHGMTAEDWDTILYCEGRENLFYDIYGEGSSIYAEFSETPEARDNYFEIDRGRTYDNWVKVTNTDPTNRVLFKQAQDFWSGGEYSPKNILLNSGLEYWGTSTSAYRWATSNTITQTDSSSGVTPKEGTYCLKLTGTGTLSALNSLASYVDTDFYSDKVLTLGAWVKSDTSNSARIFLQGSSGTTTLSKYSSYHTGGGDWEYLWVEQYMPEDCTAINVRLYSSSGATAYLDALTLTAGQLFHGYTAPTIDEGDIIYKEASWNPPSIADGSFSANDFTITGVSLEDWVLASTSIDIQDLQIRADVTATDTVTVTLYNNTGGAVDMGGIGFRFIIFKQRYS